MEPPSQEFASLLARARQGDQDALAALVRLYEPEIRRVAHYRLGPALRPYLETLDLVQSVHRSLLPRLRRQEFNLSTPENLIGLAVRMLVRKVSRHSRRVRRQQELLERRLDLGGAGDFQVAFRLPEGDPARVALLRDLLRHVSSQLDDELDRRLLELRLEGHGTASAARELGLDPDSLRVRLHRLRQRLRQAGVFTDWI
jgi:RNA polymerase sigma-70 factor (ECF subfamily)